MSQVVDTPTTEAPSTEAVVMVTGQDEGAHSEGSAVLEAKAEAVVLGKKAAKKAEEDLILAVATEVEGLSKTKALNMAQILSETVEVSYFKLGGVLKVIKDNTWFDGATDFDSFVSEQYGFQARKAHYLIQIYTDLVTKQIPWAKVSHLGWTKLKDLSPVLTVENVDEWAAKAEKLTVAELQQVLKGATPAGEAGAKTTDDFVKIAFKVKSDQAQIITTALAKAKGELNTEFDTVALENICAAYVAGSTGVAQAVDTSSVDAFIKSTDFMTLLGRIAELNPEWDITVDKAKEAS
jgi:hypothetical protein